MTTDKLVHHSHSLATDQTQLLSSYVQVLFMSSGTSFLIDSVTSLCSSLRTCLSSPPGTHACDPISESREMILQFVNQGLKKRDKVAAVKDLVDNASGDLALMAAWGEWDGAQFRQIQFKSNVFFFQTSYEDSTLPTLTAILN